MTALHIGGGQARAPLWQRFGEPVVPRGHADAVIREIMQMGEHYGVEVRGEIRPARTPRNAVLHELARGPHDLRVMGVSPRAAERLFFGELASAMLAGAQSSLLFVCPEPDGQLASRAQG
ncbi:MAG: universal stress protein [Gammaproteobacteria bacterium]|nr:universal stress protein [Gammaproteobacteria bacterium]MBV9723818.1 universal stress protein [Gammaproteobacteria bacterium]